MTQLRAEGLELILDRGVPQRVINLDPSYGSHWEQNANGQKDTLFKHQELQKPITYSAVHTYLQNN